MKLTPARLQKMIIEAYAKQGDHLRLGQSFINLFSNTTNNLLTVNQDRVVYNSNDEDVVLQILWENLV